MVIKKEYIHNILLNGDYIFILKNLNKDVVILYGLSKVDTTPDLIVKITF